MRSWLAEQRHLAAKKTLDPARYTRGHNSTGLAALFDGTDRERSTV
ncbi:hypothetical protein [Streptomyces sp. NPDC058108]